MLWAFLNHAGESALNVYPGGSSEGRQGWGHGEGLLLGGVAGPEQPRRSPGDARLAPGPGGRRARQPRARSGVCGHRARAVPHQILGGAAAGAGAQLPRAALHLRRREAALSRRAEPLPEPDKNLVSESSYEVQTPDPRCQDRSSFLRLIFALSLLPRHSYIQPASWDGCQCLCYLCYFPSPSYAKPCLVVAFCSRSVVSAKSSFTTASRARIILLLFCSSSSDSNH